MNDQSMRAGRDPEIEEVARDLMGRTSAKEWIKEQTCSEPPAAPTPDLIPPECLPLIAQLLVSNCFSR